MNYFTPPSTLVLTAALLLNIPTSSARAAEPTSEPAVPATQSWQVPTYTVPYKQPTVEQIKKTLDHVRARLEAAAGSQIVDTRTKQPVADLSKPLDGVQLDTGPERKFPPYSYPMGVIYSGMLYANEVTGDKQFADFVDKRFQMFAKNLPALSNWPKDDMRRNPFRNMLAPGNLDACGAMGAAIARAKRMNVGPNLDETITRFADYISKKQQRLEDGTFCRPRPFKQSIWLDDAYMSVPLLAQVGKITGDRKYFDVAVTQIKGFHKHLFVPETKLFTHATHVAIEDNQPKYYWGRANGWFMVATVELLDLMPEDHPERDAVIKILKQHAQGVATVQSGAGLWHQMLDRTDSYLETSCSAMFTYSMAKAVNRGWLSAAAYGPVAQAGWNGITTKIDETGHLTGTCIGTNYADDYVYYYHRPAIDDIHGYGPTLLAGAEMIKLMKNDRIQINSGSTSSTIYVDKQQDSEAQ